MLEDEQFFFEFSKEIQKGVDQNSFVLTIRIPVEHELAGVEGWRLYHDEHIPGYIMTEDRKRFTFLMDQKNLLYFSQYIEHNLYNAHIGVLIKCDFIIDVNNKAVAGHHIDGSGKSSLKINNRFDIPGGLFESWFTITKINLNEASEGEIKKGLPRIGDILSKRIVEKRKRKPFKKIEDLLDVDGITESILSDIRNLISL